MLKLVSFQRGTRISARLLAVLVLICSIWFSGGIAHAGGIDFEDGSGFVPLDTQTSVDPGYAAFDDAWYSWCWDMTPVVAFRYPAGPFQMVGNDSAVLRTDTKGARVTGTIDIAKLDEITGQGKTKKVSMLISTSGLTEILAFNAKNQLVDLQIVLKNTDTGELQAVTLKGNDITKVVVTGTPTEGCGFDSQGCISMDNFDWS